MRKKIMLAMLLLVVLLVPASLYLTVSRGFDRSLERVRESALREEAVLGRDARNRLAGCEGEIELYSTLKQTAAGMGSAYGSDRTKIVFVYFGTSVLDDIPGEIRESGLLNTKQRATYLSSAGKKFYVADRCREGVLLLLVTDVSDIYDARGTGMISAAVISGAGLLLAVILSLLISGSLTRPLKKLVKSAGELAEGNYTASLPKAGGDEIGQLTHAFADMADAVRDREESLKAQAEKKQELIDALAHEMRTPLTAIVGAARLIPQSPDRAPAMADMIAKEAMRLSRMDEDLMTLTRLNSEPVEMTEFSSLECAKEAVSCFEDVTVEGDDALWRGDRDLLIQLMRNLITNGRRSGTDTPVRLSLLPDGFDVKDHGRGMTEEEIFRAFDAFWKADKARTRAQGGAGLGLTICGRIAEVHGGKLTVDSRPGEGTIVKFRFTTPLQACEDPET